MSKKHKKKHAEQVPLYGAVRILSLGVPAEKSGPAPTHGGCCGPANPGPCGGGGDPSGGSAPSGGGGAPSGGGGAPSGGGGGM